MAEKYVDGHAMEELDLLQWDGMLSPLVSPPSTARVYFDNVLEQLQVSQNTSAYTNLVGGGGAGGSIQIGDPTVDGSWQIIIVGTTLSFQRRESGAWVEKGSMQP
jgi:hypothetical protein